MGFDQNDPRPIMNPQKRTTRVNLWMVAWMIAFFAIGGVAVWLYVQGHAGE